MSNIRTIWSCFFPCLLLVTMLRADTLDEALGKFKTESLKPGYAICLFDAKGEICSKYEGQANEETGAPFSRDTVFRIGGISDIFTVVMALQLVDAGLINPEKPIAAYLPEIFSGSPSGSSLEKIGSLKVKVLMSHLSGTSANFFNNFCGYDPFLNLKSYLENLTLKYPPETKYLRSSAMIDLLGLAIENASGKRFEELAKTALFEPLGMEASSFRYLDSPQFASLSYKSAAPNSYATRIPGFRETVAPSSSMQSSIRDLVAFYSTLLQMNSSTATPLLSRKSLDAMFSSRNGDVLRRQGFQIGYIWKLSLPELAYLGKVAWASGKYLSHRNVVILLPELGIGVVCATNHWSIIDRETILPMAVEVLKTYTRENLKVLEPTFPVPVRVPTPRTLNARIAGIYASIFGVYQIDPKKDSIHISSNTLEVILDHIGKNEFQTTEDSPLEKVRFTPPDSLNLFMKDGMIIDTQRIDASPRYRAWLTHQGTYRITRSPTVALYAFTIRSFKGRPVISGDDGVELLIKPFANDSATIQCDESSQFFGKVISISNINEITVDGIPYKRGF